MKCNYHGLLSGYSLGRASQGAAGRGIGEEARQQNLRSMTEVVHRSSMASVNLDESTMLGDPIES